MLDQFKTFARYNAWANQRLYAACALLDDQAYYADRQAFFGSIHRTLNHLVLGDRIWFGRIEAKPFAVTGLDQVLYEDRHALSAARAEEDRRIERVIDGLAEAQLAGDLEYQTTKGTPQRT
ncbi:MAG: DinB family protein, partial [Rhodospirillales bacterium]|nr:DinB family protein [Rhodospirillales bacterium]